MELEKGLGHKYDEEQLRELGVLRLGKKEALFTLYNSLKGHSSQMCIGPSSQAATDRARGNGLWICQESFRLCIRNNFLWKGLSSTGTGGGVIILGGI